MDQLVARLLALTLLHDNVSLWGAPTDTVDRSLLKLRLGKAAEQAALLYLQAEVKNDPSFKAQLVDVDLSAVDLQYFS